MPADHFVIDPGMSRFTVRGYAAGMLSSLGHNPVVAVRDLTGEVQLDPETLEGGTLRVAIPAASLEVQNDASEKDRREMQRVMDEEVLETARYPAIVFESTSVSATRSGPTRFSARIEGNLTLHGIKRPRSFPAQVSITGDLLRANGEFSVLQSDFAIKQVSVAGGALKLKDELKLACDIVARAGVKENTKCA